MGDEIKGGDAGSGGGAAPAAAAPPQKEPNIVLKGVDMSDEMQSHACACARAAFQEHTVEKNIAEYIKKEFDAKYGQSWHCIVGRNFGSFVTHEAKHFIYFYVDSKAVLLFKSG